jgi:hypothetical protein
MHVSILAKSLKLCASSHHQQPEPRTRLSFTKSHHPGYFGISIHLKLFVSRREKYHYCMDLSFMKSEKNSPDDSKSKVNDGIQIYFTVSLLPGVGGRDSPIPCFTEPSRRQLVGEVSYSISFQKDV